MSIDAKALRDAALRFSVDFELEAVALVAVDRNGAVVCIIIDESSSSACRLAACQNLGEWLVKCHRQVATITEQFISELLVPEPDKGSTSN